MDRMAWYRWRGALDVPFPLMRGVMRMGLALLVALAGVSDASLAAGQGPAEAHSAVPESATPDMVVTVETLRRVRVVYSRFGPYMRGCQITQSSGSAGVDAFVCVLLRQCILRGNLEPPAAKRCLDARIASVRSGQDDAAQGEAEDEEPVVIATPFADPPQPPPPPPLPALDTALGAVRGTAPATAPATRKARPDVASAVTAGLWHVRHGPILRDRVRRGDVLHFGAEWTVCVAETEPGRALARLLDAPVQVDIGRACSGFVAGPRGGRFVANRSCLFRSQSTLNYDVSGTLGPDRLHAFVRLTSDPVQQLERRTSSSGARYSLDAERVGDCPPAR